LRTRARSGDNAFVPRPHSPEGPRPEPPDIAELTELKATQPELASAIDLQIELIRLERRVRPRLPLPSLALETEGIRAALESGRPLLRFEALAFNWSDFRFVFRTVAELMRRYDALDEADYRRTEDLAREADRLEPLVVAWFATGVDPGSANPPPDLADLEPVIQLAMRPFLARSAEALAAADFSEWTRGCCPLCGGEPEFATITPAAERFLLCSRCTTRWKFDPMACPYCGNAERDRITSFASRDGRYRIYACDECLRYLKAYDGRHASRPVMFAVDTIATLPLDAAAMQRGYRA
jgi:formate dehydrogenase maturation protein FdhE